MMRSMFSGISGLRVHQTKMDVIANNISNVNTVGYKSSRTTFSDFFSQNVGSATAASDQNNRGGTNPMQVGLGAAVASIDINMSTGAAQRTDKPLDLMIQGDGFFIVGDNSGTYFTRAGAFNLDASGNLTNSNGMILMGWDADPDPNNPGQQVVSQGTVEPIKIQGDDLYSPPASTTAVEMAGNLQAIGEENHEFPSNMSIFDSLGNEYVIGLKYIYDETAMTWDVQMSDYATVNGDDEVRYKVHDIVAASRDSDFTDATAGTSGEIKIGGVYDPSDTTNPGYVSIGTIDFNASGLIDNPLDATGSTISTITEYNTNTGGMFMNFVVSADGDLPAEAFFGADGTTGDPPDPLGTVKLEISNLTQFNDTPDASSTTLDGCTSGNMSGLSISDDGKIVVSYTNGDSRVVKQLAIANFANPAGLEKMGNNLFGETMNSGQFNGTGIDVTSIGSAIKSGVLEMSNVDLSQEFTDMIITQRGYQANSRIITTSDEILQELVNLKR